MTDLEIARSVRPRPILDVASDLGLPPDRVIPWGRDKAKIEVDGLGAPRGRLVLVSAITPTPAGEGKTTTSIALAQGLARIGERACLALREPSLGPAFGVKGGAAGGGHAQVIPMEDINLHFTGDFHAVTSAHNLLAAMLDNHLHFGNELGIEPRTGTWRRVMDMNDRALRQIVVGLGGKTMGIPRDTGFDITAASEVMAILCLARDAADLRARLARIVVGLNRAGDAVRAADLGADGAMAVLLRDALLPNLVQTLEGTPALLHGGPFGNIAHGCNSIIATRAALSLADWVVTEAGFGFDLGAEKFLDIKCRVGDLAPSAAVVVATIRALKMHGGRPLAELSQPDAAAVERGLPNLERHLDSAAAFELKPVVALNHFGADTDEEVAVVQRLAARRGLPFAVCRGFAEGGRGAEALAKAVVEEGREAIPGFRPVYELSAPAEDKVEQVARRIYGADGVDWTSKAKADLGRARRIGCGDLPVCIAKTQSSLSDDPARLGRPEGFRVTVREVHVAAGAGYLVPITGEMLRMPGLPRRPAAERIGLDDLGRVEGLS